MTIATWLAMAEDNRSAAKELLSSKRFRSSVNRAYYAVYCIVASVLEGCADFGYGGNNPTHEQLEPLILNNLRSLSKNDRYDLRKAVRRLRGARILADYVPAERVDETIALQAGRDVRQVFVILGVKQ